MAYTPSIRRLANRLNDFADYVSQVDEDIDDLQITDEAKTYLENKVKRQLKLIYDDLKTLLDSIPVRSS